MARQLSKRQLASNYLLRFGVVFTSRLAGFVIVPLLIACLGVSGYGYYSLALSMALIFPSILSLRLHSAVIRFFPKTREAAGAVVVVGLGYWLLLALLSFAVLAIAGDALAEYVFRTSGLTTLLVLAVALGLGTILYEFVSVTLCAENRFGLISVVDAAERVIFVVCCCLLLLVGHGSVVVVLGLLAATMLGKVLAVCPGSLKGIHWSWPDWRLVRKMVLFSLPFLPHLVSLWVMQRSAFFYIAEVSGAEAVGTFGIAFTLANLVLAVALPIQTVLYPMIREAFDDGQDGLVKELLSTTVRGVLLVGVFGTISLCLGVTHAFELMSMRAAAPQWSFLLVLSLASILAALRQVLINLIRIGMNTKVMAVISPLGALVCVSFYLLFLDRIGILAAALGLLLGTAVQFGAICTQVPRHLLPLPPRRFLFALTCSGAAAALIQWAAGAVGPWPFVLGLLLSSIAFSGGIFWLGGITDTERRTMWHMLYSGWTRVIRANR